MPTLTWRASRIAGLIEAASARPVTARQFTGAHYTIEEDGGFRPGRPNVEPAAVLKLVYEDSDGDANAIDLGCHRDVDAAKAAADHYERTGETPASASSPVPPILDDNFFLYSQGYELQRVYVDSAARSIRVRVKRDTYERQSYAVVDVLTPALTWTNLAEEAPAKWHGDSPYAHTGFQREVREAEALVGEIADDLVLRAIEILPHA